MATASAPHQSPSGVAAVASPRPILHLDWESRSDVDLKACGVYVYAAGQNTDIICAAYAFDDEPVALWTPSLPVPQSIVAHVDAGGEIMAHNAQFERLIWQHIAAPRYGWPVARMEQFTCTAAMAAAMSLPRALGQLAVTLGLSEEKDDAGHRLMLQLSKPRSINDDGSIVWWGDDAKDKTKLDRLYAYCVQDVVVERRAEKSLRRLTPHERDIYLLDQRINDRGIKVDLALVTAAQHVADIGVERSNVVLRQITAGAVTTATDHRALTTWLQSQGVDTNSVAKAAVAGLLEGDLMPVVREALEVRTEAGRTSIAKLKAFLDVAGDGDRARGLLLYHAASTGRWGGRLLQPHNFPRGEVEGVDEYIPLIMAGEYDLIDLSVHPITVVSSMLRSMLVADEGKDLIAADFSAIEARVVNWLAGQDDVLDLFRQGIDVYKHNATKLYNIAYEDVSKHQRQTGKFQELGCFGPETLVLTSRGAQSITDLLDSDMLWDGEQWTSHGGLAPRGQKETIRWLGIDVTPDHLIWTGTEWLTAAHLADPANIRSLNSAIATASLRSSGLPTEHEAASSRRSSGVPADGSPTSYLGTISEKGCQLGATLVRSSPPDAHINITAATRMSSLMILTEDDCSTVSAPPHSGARTRKASSTTTTAGGASVFSRTGARVWPAARRGLRIWSHFRDGRNLGSIWTALITTKGTSRATCASSPAPTTAKTADASPICNSASRNSKQKMLVFDIANCGPRNRFTILTDAGPLLVHNCGFGMGAAKAVRAAKDVFGLTLTDDEAKVIVTMYRATHKAVVSFWYETEHAVKRAIEIPNAPVTFGAGGRLKTIVAGAYLYIILPSGRPLVYPAPRIVMAPPPWGGEDRPQIEYSAPLGPARRWGRERTYGGKLVENITQAFARDLLADAMLRGEERGYIPVLSVHDETVAEIPKGFGSMEEFESIMCELPAWADGCPVAAEGWRGDRFRK